MMNKFYVTTAIDYPNAKPHLGHAFEKIIADVFARWNRLNGKKTFFSTGTDEHGQKLEKYAKDAKIPPKEFVDKNVLIFKELCASLNISHDTFIRTTDPHHEKLCQNLFQKVLDKKEIYLDKYSGNYCIYDETFFTEKDLVDGKKCPVCGRETNFVSEDAYFFKLSQYQEAIIRHIETTDFIRPITRRNEILSRLKKEPLRDLCVSRTSFSWGIPLLNDQRHIIYVWFDALINYLSAIDYPDGKNALFWPADVHVIGKDIIWFHTVIWSAMLMAAQVPLPRKVYAHGFILMGAGEKMSKSKGNVIDPVTTAKKYGADPFRYYLMRVIPSADDGNFSEEELVQKYNNELGNDLGNLVMRCVKLGLNRIGEQVAFVDCDDSLQSERITAFTDAERFIQNCEYDRALQSIWNYVKKINVYLAEKEPWKITNKDEVHKIIYVALQNLSFAITLLKPFIPATADSIEKQLGVTRTLKYFDNLTYSPKDTYFLTDASALFPKIEYVDDSFLLNLRVAEIIKAELHPNAENLLVLQINLGSEQRQLVAGLRKHYAPEALIGKKIIVLANLKPAKLRGVESQGMLLAGVDGDQVKLLSPNKSNIGDLVYFETKNINQSQIAYDDFKKYSLLVKEGKVYLNSSELKTDLESISVDLTQGNVF